MRLTILVLLFFPLFAAGQESGHNQSTTGKDDPVFTVVEQMPQFPGGQDSLLHYIAYHTNYPKACKDSSIEGTVYVQFIVDTMGHARASKVLRKVHPLMDEEAVRVINSMPDWKPGEQSGKKVNVYYTIPFHFQLN